MSWFDRFRRQSKADPPSRFDVELLRRLDILAIANGQIKNGDFEASQVNLSPNVNEQGVLEADRPAVGFRLEPLDRRDDTPDADRSGLCRSWSGSWVLLKCSQPGPFFIGFDATTGAAEMFPRRYDVDGYAFALEMLRVVA